MTDGNYPVRLQHFAYRGCTTPGRPGFLAMKVGGRSEPQRIEATKELAQIGFPTFHGKYEIQAKMFEAIPESFGKSDEQIKAMPEYVRNFKCGGQLEKGQPFCDAEKYSGGICPGRNFKAGWHPGL